MLTLSFSPLLPVWALVALGVALLAVTIVAFLTRGSIAALRALALALVLAALAGPSVVQEERDPVRSVVAVVIDRSTSQTLGDRPEMTTQLREEAEEHPDREVGS